MNSSPQHSSGSFRSWLQQRTVLYTLLGVFLGLLFPVVASLIKVLELGQSVSLPHLLAVHGADRLLWIIDTAPFFLGLLAGIAGRREDLHLQANRLLREREGELNSIRQGLEESIAERARQLDQRNAQLRSVVTFARQVADIQDLSTLLSTSVRMISERFEHSDVDLFLLDENRQHAALKASSRPGGSELVKDGYRIALNEETTVARVARRGTLMVAPLRPENPEDAASAATETALPLTVRGRAVGVLDVRTKASTPPDAEMLQLLADQLAASIENARLASESRLTVQQLQAAGSQSTLAAWQQFLKRSSIAYQLTPSGVRPAVQLAANGSSGGLKIPLRLRGQEIGSISVKRSSGKGWTEAERDLMEKLAAQVALAVENARLIEETRQRAAQEQVISDVSARFSRSLDVEALLQAAAREFAALPEVAEATVVLKPSGESGPQAQN